jgi:hypothetical protein
MQTFLPYPSFKQSAAALDYRRLGKQRVEVLQLLNSISKLKKGEPVRGWKNHPCRKMWHNYTNALVNYGLDICREWVGRGYNDTCFNKISMHFNHNEPVIIPSFIGNNQFHLSHKSMLIQKMPEYYKRQWPDVSDNLEYIWPEED